MSYQLADTTVEFIESLDHDDLVCFLKTYSQSTQPVDIAQYEALRAELIKKLSVDKTEQELWDMEVTQ